jgi:hypothetical protein
MDTRYEVKDAAIHLFIPAKKDGKYRFKQRTSRYEFGQSFAAREKPFNNTVYLEWQIGYDVTLQDYKNGKKHTELTSTSFKGSNKKQKYPYELSELLLKSTDIGLLKTSDLTTLLKEITSYDDFISNRAITCEPLTSVSLNGIDFRETKILLPTFYMIDTMDTTQIEVSIEKQQYGTDTQPMVYFCIPLHAFMNGAEFQNRSSVPGEDLIYVIDSGNVQNLILMMKIFATASKDHQFDMCEILKLLIQLAKK